jgi:hypothetical protein
MPTPVPTDEQRQTVCLLMPMTAVGFGDSSRLEAEQLPSMALLDRPSTECGA